MRFKLVSFLVVLFIFLISGCASFFAKLAPPAVKNIKMPQIAADLEPVIKDNKIFVLGKIVIQNYTESNIWLDKIFLTITDNLGNVLETSVLDWEITGVLSEGELGAPVNIGLDLATLDRESVTINLKTAFIYKKLNIRVPIESKAAVLHLGFLKESIKKPLKVNIYTKLYFDIFGRAFIDYSLGVTNPTVIDLLLENGVIRVFTVERSDIVKVSLPSIFFKEGEESRIEGTVDLGNIFDIVMNLDFLKIHPLRFQLLGELKVPDTGILMPFKFESAQEVDFSFFRR